MKIYITKNYDDLSKKAANIMASQIIMKPNCVLGFATGASPVGLYKQLIKYYESGDLDFAEVSTVNLDEYKGLSSDDPNSYHQFMQTNLFSHINVDPKNVFLPDGLAKNSDEECERYNKVISSLGGVDLQLLGIGTNSHIGFNEPSDSFAKETNCIELSQSTIIANSKYFDNDSMPKYAYTMGIKSIMQAKKILLVANGKGKAKALKDSLTGPITPSVPASILQLHSDLTVVADEDAFSLMR